MGTADHRNCALAEDRNPAWTLPDPVDECETEAEAFAGLARCNSLLTMGGTKPMKKKKRPVLLLDPEEAANAHSELALTAAQDFADPERAASRQPAIGLSSADQTCSDDVPSQACDEDWREWAARVPTPLSTLPLDPEPEAAEPAPIAWPEGSTADHRNLADEIPGSAPTRVPVEPPAVEADAAEPVPAPLRPARIRRDHFVEVPFEDEGDTSAEASVPAPVHEAAPEPERSTLRRTLQMHPVQSEPATPSLAGLLARLRAAIGRLTGRR